MKDYISAIDVDGAFEKHRKGATEETNSRKMNRSVDGRGAYTSAIARSSATRKSAFRANGSKIF